MWPKLARFGQEVAFEVGGSCGRQVPSQSVLSHEGKVWKAKAHRASGNAAWPRPPSLGYGLHWRKLSGGGSQRMAFPGVQDGLNRAWVHLTAAGWASWVQGLQQRCMHMGEGPCLPLLQASGWGRNGGSGLLRHAQEASISSPCSKSKEAAEPLGWAVVSCV